MDHSFLDVHDQDKIIFVGSLTKLEDCFRILFEKRKVERVLNLVKTSVARNIFLEQKQT